MKYISDLIKEGEILYLFGLPKDIQLSPSGYLMAFRLIQSEEFSHYTEIEAQVISKIYNRNGKFSRLEDKLDPVLESSITRLIESH